MGRRRESRRRIPHADAVRRQLPPALRASQPSDRPRDIETAGREEDRMSLRKLGAQKPWPLLMIVAMFLSGIAPSFVPAIQAQTAPVGNGFVVNADDL